MTVWWYVIGKFFCCAVATQDGVITTTPPLLRKFRNQPLTNLKRWQQTVSIKEIK